MVYVFVVIEIASQRIVHTNATTHPTLSWVQQQLRDATAWGTSPHCLVHDIVTGWTPRTLHPAANSCT